MNAANADQLGDPCLHPYLDPYLDPCLDPCLKLGEIRHVKRDAQLPALSLDTMCYTFYLVVFQGGGVSAVSLKRIESSLGWVESSLDWIESSLDRIEQ